MNYILDLQYIIYIMIQCYFQLLVIYFKNY